MSRKLFYWACLAVMIAVPSSCDKTEEKVDGDPDPGSKDVVLAGESGAWAMPEQSDEVVQTYIVPEAPFEYDKTFEYDPTNFPNPERGPYNPISYSYINGNIPKLASVSDMTRTRESGCSLMFSHFYLCDFLNSVISDEVLAHIRTHFSRVREAGCKTIVRFAYSWYWDAGDKTQQEPDTEIILAQIAQLKPIFEEFADIIYVVQMGFVGTYGEWAYTTNVTKRSDRSQIVKAVLDALPARRQVALRTPSHMRMTLSDITGKSFKLRDSVTVATAFDGSYVSRIACFNDCAFVNYNDGGTYADEADRLLWSSSSNYVALGGESCFVGDDKYCQCIPSYKNLRTFHWSYLSNHHDIIKIWQAKGCYDDASARVGYRFVLNGAVFSGLFTAGGKFEVKLCLGNYGFASLINPHDLEFVIGSESDPSEQYVIKSATDPRYWQGSHYYVHTENLVLPDGLKAGEKYTLSIRIADAEPNLHDRPEYSVRFANKNVWDANTGCNRLGTFTAK